MRLGETLLESVGSVYRNLRYRLRMLLGLIVKAMGELGGPRHPPLVLAIGQAIAEQKRHALGELLAASYGNAAGEQHPVQVAQGPEAREPVI